MREGEAVMQPLDTWLTTTLDGPHKQVVQAGRLLAKALQEVRRCADNGDVSGLTEALAQIGFSAPDLVSASHIMSRELDKYDIRGFLDGQFDAEFRSAAAAKQLHVEGTFPTYYIAPVRVAVDVKSLRVRINRKVFRGLRVPRVIDEVTAIRDRITKRTFNAKELLRELSDAYDDLVALEKTNQPLRVTGIDRSLRSIYERLTPRREWRNQYPEAFFAYDLHRLLGSGELYCSDGRRYFLTPSRNSRMNLSIMDLNDRVIQYGMISFRKE